MNEAMRALTICLSICMVAGCVPYKRTKWSEVPVAQDQLDDNSSKRIEANDVLRIRTKQGVVYQVKVDDLEQRGFVGTWKDNKRYRFYYKDLESIEVQHIRWRWLVVAY